MLRLPGWLLVASLLALLHAGAAVASIRALGGWGAEGASAVGCGCRRVEHCDERAVGSPGSFSEKSRFAFAPNQPDSENRLVSLNASEAGYLYDGDGQLVRRTVGGVATTYLVDDQTPAGYMQVAEERVGGVVARSYVFGPQRVSMRGPEGVRWYVYDAHSGVRGLADGSGAMTDAYEYDAFGSVVTRTGSTDNIFAYRGEQMDSVSGFQYLRARWRSFSYGRFHTRDTCQGLPGAPDSGHAYSYAWGDPVNLEDGSGNDPTGELLVPAIDEAIETSGSSLSKIAGRYIVGVEATRTLAKMGSYGLMGMTEASRDELAELEAGDRWIAGINLDSSAVQTMATMEPGAYFTQIRMGLFIMGRAVYMTTPAIVEFGVGLKRYANAAEKVRAFIIMSNCTELPDNPSARVRALTKTKAIKYPDTAIFGTGDRYNLTTVTTDGRFVTAAAAQGVVLDAVVYPSYSWLDVPRVR